VHAFTDGRDVDQNQEKNTFKIYKIIATTPVKIASVIGRYYAMDRDKRWERVKHL
jgi:2,3-bisphosphoglycerate-independent phosphoglycerate mutase